MWFEIKVKNSWLEGSRHVLKQLYLERELNEGIQKTVIPYMRSSEWNAHSEHILQTMLAGDDVAERSNQANSSHKRRQRTWRSQSKNQKMPKLNEEAKTL